MSEIREEQTVDARNSDDSTIGSKIHIFESEKLGEGSYGSVYRCCNDNGDCFAVKCIQCNDTGIPNILESSIMKTISHPNLNTAVHIHTSSSEIHIFQEMAKTDLARHTRKREKLISPSLLRKWSFEIVQGLACLHRQNIIHADVKASNVLLFEDQSVKLGDFTLCVRVKETFSSKPLKKSFSANDAQPRKMFNHRVCTYSHRPPECWLEKDWSYPLDIWSLGCTLFEIAYGRLLFPSQGKITDKESKKDVYDRALRCLVEWAKVGPNASQAPPWIQNIEFLEEKEYRKATLPSAFKQPEYRTFNQLILWMLQIDPTRRPKIDDILKHCYFRGMQPKSYKIVSTPCKIIPFRERKRLIKYMESVKNPEVRTLALELYSRCVSLKSISETLKISACVWISNKLNRIKPENRGISRRLLLESERKICEHLSFRLHISSSTSA